MSIDTSTPAATTYPSPIFQAFTIKTINGRARLKADNAVTNVLGSGWEVTTYGGMSSSFEVYRHEGVLTPSEAWEITYQLRAQQGVTSVEPVFKAWVTDREDWGINLEPGAESSPELEKAIPEGVLEWLCGPGSDLQQAKENDWSLILTKVKQAWESHFPGQNNREGKGVIVGHPDTGYRNHPEIARNLLVNKGFDFFHNDTDPKDELEGGFGRNPGHGTGTASVIVSPKGAPAGTAPSFVSGAAPGATLIPFRVSDSVVILDGLNLARAVEGAADAGSHIISISMGGIGSERLHDAIIYAKNQGVIVLAAAGNCVSFVVFPAGYEEVVAVAACDAEKGIWKGSSRGAAVDVTAPGDRVWHAVASVDDNLDNVAQGSGTSYAVATVAGIAALWLAKHGRNKIIKACGGKEKIASAFIQLVRTTSTSVPGWPPGQFGGGLINADKLLDAALPGGTTEPIMLDAPQGHAPVGRGGVATFSHLFDDAMRTGQGGQDMRAVNRPIDSRIRLRNRLVTLLRTTEGKLPIDLGQIGQELAFYLATDPTLYRRIANSISLQGSRTDESKDARVYRPSDQDVEEVRQQLLVKGVSTALGAKLRKL
jgi:hypothetical protein